MTMERLIRLIAGTFILASLALGYWVSHWFFLFTAFVGANLFQSALTNWCLMEDILGKFGYSAAGRKDKTSRRRPRGRGVHRHCFHTGDGLWRLPWRLARLPEPDLAGRCALAVAFACPNLIL